MVIFTLPSYRSSDALAEKLHILIEDKDLRIKMGKAANDEQTIHLFYDEIVGMYYRFRLRTKVGSAGYERWCKEMFGG